MAATDVMDLSPEANDSTKVSISSLYGADLASAVGASFMVSPLITIVDRSIIQNASGAMTIGTSVRAGMRELFLKPHVFLRRREFLMVWGVYTTTYITANMIITTCEQSRVDDRLPKFIGTSLVNVITCISKRYLEDFRPYAGGLSVVNAISTQLHGLINSGLTRWRMTVLMETVMESGREEWSSDREFTRMFGTLKPKPLPVSTYVLFTIRDATTVGASFNLPDPVSVYLQERLGMSKETAAVTAQLACPAGIQFLSTPLHLLGLDLYNKPNNSAASRAKFIASALTPSVAMRICRIGPAFGIGGVGNTAFRNHFRSVAGS